MARTKQTQRKAVGGKAPRKDLALAKKTVAGPVVRAPRRYRPGTVAIRGIFKYQSRGKFATELLFRKRPFGRLAREIAQDLRTPGSEPSRFEPGALSALQHASEAYLVNMFGEAQDYALHARREGIDSSDINMAKWKMNTTPEQRNLGDCPVVFKQPRKSKTPRRRRKAVAGKTTVLAIKEGRKVPAKKKPRTSSPEPEEEEEFNDEELEEAANEATDAAEASE